MLLYCIVLHCVALRCVALRCVALRCVALRCVALRCVALRCVALRCVALYCIVVYCILLYSIVFYCILLCCMVFDHTIPAATYRPVVAGRSLRHDCVLQARLVPSLRLMRPPPSPNAGRREVNQSDPNSLIPSYTDQPRTVLITQARVPTDDARDVPRLRR